MRILACLLLLLGGAVALQAAETWRWRDANGVVHFSDVPVPGAERVNVGPAPRPGSVATAPRTSAGSRQDPGEGRIVPYARCVLLAPVNDFVAVNEPAVQVVLDLQPGLQEGHMVQMLLNGQPVPGWPAAGTQSTLDMTERGSFTLVARVIDDFGRALCTSPLVNFHVRLPTVPTQRARPLPAPRGG
jgi:hypothetical protein